MANLTTQQIYALARGAGFSASEAVTATAVALAESGGDPAAVGDTGIQTAKWGPSVGLWQVRTLKAERGKGTIRDYDWLLASPANQAKAAFQVRNGSNGWKNWSVYSSGSYAKNVSSVQAAVGQQEKSSGDAWWQKLLSSPVSAGGLLGFVVGTGTAISRDDVSTGDVVSGVGNAVEDKVTSSVLGESGTQLLETLNSPQFWKRVGIGVAGGLIIVLAILIMVWAGKDKILKSTVGSAVSGAVSKGK